MSATSKFHSVAESAGTLCDPGHDRLRLRLLSVIGEALLAADNPDELMQQVFQQLAGDLQLDAYFNYMLNERGDALELRSYAGVPNEIARRIVHLKLGHAVCGTVAATRQPLIVNEVRNAADPALQFIRSLGFRAYACHPLLNGAELLGTLSLASRQKDRFEPQDIDFIQMLTRFIVLATVRLRHKTALLKSEEQLRATKQQLEEYAHTLEQRVEQRTASLRISVESLEDVLYTLAHDLRAPNRALSGFSEILLEDYRDKLDDTGRSILKKISRAARRNDELIRDLLDLGQLAQQELPCRVIPLGQVVQHTLREMQPRIERAHAAVEVASVWPNVWANEEALDHALSHLLANALTYAPPGQSPRVRLWADTQPGDPPCVRLYVEDRGIGVASKYQETIFRPFQRLNACQWPDGTGIGLAIVRKAAERMGGQAGVRSEGPGRGSCFWLDLRCATPGQPHPLGNCIPAGSQNIAQSLPAQHQVASPD